MYQIIDVLGKNARKSSGRQGQWLAKCPVHNDKDFAMRIKENGEGGLSITCYACGANGLDVYRQLGLDLRELFGKDNDDPNYVPYKVRDTHTEDQFFMAIYRSEYAKGHKPTAADAKRMRLAVRRSQAMEAKYPALKKTLH